MSVAPPDPALRVAVAQASLTGESPFWHPGEQALYYCDIPGHQLLRWHTGSESLNQWHFDTDISAAAPRRDGGLLLARRDGIFRFDPASAVSTLLASPPYDPAKQRFNDGRCDPQGRFWVGTLCEPRLPPLGTMQCFSDGVLRQRFDGVSNSNGLAWSPDARTMYWSDTQLATVFAFDFDPADGTLSRRRVFIEFPAKKPGQALDDYLGRPDGASVDSEGCYWVAMYEGQRLLRISPRGEVLRHVHLPVRCATMCAFGGDDLKTLYITTARENRPAEELAEQPLAGCVLALPVDVPGLPVDFAL